MLVAMITVLFVARRSVRRTVFKHGHLNHGHLNHGDINWDSALSEQFLPIPNEEIPTLYLPWKNAEEMEIPDEEGPYLPWKNAEEMEIPDEEGPDPVKFKKIKRASLAKCHVNFAKTYLKIPNEKIPNLDVLEKQKLRETVFASLRKCKEQNEKTEEEIERYGQCVDFITQANGAMADFVGIIAASVTHAKEVAPRAAFSWVGIPDEFIDYACEIWSFGGDLIGAVKVAQHEDDAEAKNAEAKNMEIHQEAGSRIFADFWQRYGKGLLASICESAIIFVIKILLASLIKALMVAIGIHIVAAIGPFLAFLLSCLFIILRIVVFKKNIAQYIKTFITYMGTFSFYKEGKLGTKPKGASTLSQNAPPSLSQIAQHHDPDPEFFF